MTDEKEPMQASGSGGVGAEIAEEETPPSAGRPDMGHNRGESGGGAYPSPHNDPENAKPEDRFMGHGGQSEMRYYGDGEPGSDSIAEADNAVNEDED